jgi:hypothetical protein
VNNLLCDSLTIPNFVESNDKHPKRVSMNEPLELRVDTSLTKRWTDRTVGWSDGSDGRTNGWTDKVFAHMHVSQQRHVGFSMDKG